MKELILPSLVFALLLLALWLRLRMQVREQVNNAWLGGYAKGRQDVIREQTQEGEIR